MLGRGRRADREGKEREERGQKGRSWDSWQFSRVYGLDSCVALTLISDWEHGECSCGKASLCLDGTYWSV
jgi:hypothetical protein